MVLADTVIRSISELRPDLDGIYAQASEYSARDWRERQLTQVTVRGAAASAIPGAHVASLTTEVLHLVHQMSTCSYGIGAICGRDATVGNVLEREDIDAILQLWAYSKELADRPELLSDAHAVRIASKSATNADVRSIARTILADLNALTGGMIQQSVNTKAGAKIGARLSAKLGSKSLVGFVPFLGNAVGSVIHAWLINSVADVAERYYEFKCNIAKQL